MLDNHRISAVAIQKDSVSTVMMKIGDFTMRASFSELAPCLFPIEWHQQSLCIPSHGSKVWMTGRIPGGVKVDGGDDLMSSEIRVPIYASEEVINECIFSEFYHTSATRSDEGADQLIKIPIILVATETWGVLDDSRKVLSFNVLPIWKDGTAVLITLDWSEGYSEYATNPEWYMHASPGLPVEQAFNRLKQRSRISPMLEDCTFRIFTSPALLGTHIFGDAGMPYVDSIWRRQWEMTTCEQLAHALARLEQWLVQPAVPDSLTSSSTSEDTCKQW